MVFVFCFMSMLAIIINKYFCVGLFHAHQQLASSFLIPLFGTDHNYTTHNYSSELPCVVIPSPFQIGVWIGVSFMTFMKKSFSCLHNNDNIVGCRNLEFTTQISIVVAPLTLGTLCY